MYGFKLAIQISCLDLFFFFLLLIFAVYACILFFELGYAVALGFVHMANWPRCRSLGRYPV